MAKMSKKDYGDFLAMINKMGGNRPVVERAATSTGCGYNRDKNDAKLPFLLNKVNIDLKAFDNEKVQFQKMIEYKGFLYLIQMKEVETKINKKTKEIFPDWIYKIDLQTKKMTVVKGNVPTFDGKTSPVSIMEVISTEDVIYAFAYFFDQKQARLLKLEIGSNIFKWSEVQGHDIPFNGNRGDDFQIARDHENNIVHMLVTVKNQTTVHSLKVSSMEQSKFVIPIEKCHIRNVGTEYGFYGGKLFQFDIRNLSQVKVLDLETKQAETIGRFEVHPPRYYDVETTQYKEQFFIGDANCKPDRVVKLWSFDMKERKWTFRDDKAVYKEMNFHTMTTTKGGDLFWFFDEGFAFKKQELYTCSLELKDETHKEIDLLLRTKGKGDEALSSFKRLDQKYLIETYGKEPTPMTRDVMGMHAFTYKK